MKSEQQKKSLDRFIYESMGEKQYLISCLDDDLFKKALKGFPYVPVCQLSKGIYLFKQKFHFLIRLLKAIRRITDQDSFKGTGLK